MQFMYVQKYYNIPEIYYRIPLDKRLYNSAARPTKSWTLLLVLKAGHPINPVSIPFPVNKNPSWKDWPGLSRTVSFHCTFWVVPIFPVIVANEVCFLPECP